MLATRSTILIREVEYRRLVSNFYERMAFLNYTLVSLRNYDGDVNAQQRLEITTDVNNFTGIVSSDVCSLLSSAPT